MNALIQATGKFIATFATWTWWCSFTFKREVSLGRAIGDLRRWANRVARRAGCHVTIAYGIERQLRGVVHFHAVVAFSEGTVPTSWGKSDWWHGIANIEPYDPTRGAAWYLAEENVWGIMLGCPRHPGCRRRGGCVAARKSPPIPTV